MAAATLLIFLLRWILWAVSTVLGSVGVFCVIYSFLMPYLAAQGLVLLATALAIVCFTDR